MPDKKPGHGLVSMHTISTKEWAESHGSEDEPKRVLERTRGMLKLAHRGLDELLSGEMDKQIVGICDVAVYGRSVSLAAQHARTRALDAFNRWYAPWESEMQSDELFKYFNHLRNEVLKDGSPRAIGYRGFIDNKKYFDAILPAMKRVEKEVAGYKSPASFALSEVVGVGVYEFTNIEGEKASGTMELPAELWQNLRLFTYLPQPPKTHAGNPIGDVTLQNLATPYIKRLDQFVADFEVFISGL